MNQALLVAWLALAAADRFDFLGGAGAFFLSPFLVLTPLVLGAEMLRLAARGERVRIPEGALHYLFWMLCFLATVLVSVLFAYDVDLATRRYALWLVQVMGPFAVAVLIAQYPAPERILVKGAYWGIGFGWFMNLVQIYIFATGKYVNFTEPIPFAKLLPTVYAGIAPRLSMQVLDQNRAGIVFVFYLFCLYLWAPPSRWRTTFLVMGGLGVVLTTSRSVALGVTAMLAVHYLQKRRMRLTRGRVLGAAIAGSLLMALIAANPEPVVRVAEPVGKMLVSRFTLKNDESASIHFELIAYGFELASSKVKIALVGVGFGNSPVVLEQFFDEDAANFHSYYTTLLVECGTLALILGVLLMALPALRSPTYRPMMAGLAAFNIFYQVNTEPLFWFVLALAWMGLSAGIRHGAPPVLRRVQGPAPPLRTLEVA